MLLLKFNKIHNLLIKYQGVNFQPELISYYLFLGRGSHYCKEKFKCLTGQVGLDHG